MMNETIAKPMSVARADFISSLTDLINTSDLPPFVIEDVLKDFTAKVKVISQEQLDNDRRWYNDNLSKSKKST